MAELTAGEIGAGLTGIGGVIQAGLGFLEKWQKQKELDKLFKQRKAIQTPEEIAKILQATENYQGGDQAMVSYLTGQTNQAFSAGLGTAERLGADPNLLSANYHRTIDDIMKIGAENHAIALQQFGSYLGALKQNADYDTARQISLDNIQRDRMAAKGVQFQNATAATQSGLNALIGAGSSLAAMQLYKDKNKITDPLKAITVAGSASDFS